MGIRNQSDSRFLTPDSYFRPSARVVVHHSLFFLDAPAQRASETRRTHSSRTLSSRTLQRKLVERDRRSRRDVQRIDGGHHRNARAMRACVEHRVAEAITFVTNHHEYPTWRHLRGNLA